MVMGGCIQLHLTAVSAAPVVVSDGGWNKPKPMLRNGCFYLKKVDGGKGSGGGNLIFVISDSQRSRSPWRLLYWHLTLMNASVK